MPATSTISLVPLLCALLDLKIRDENRERQEAEVTMKQAQEEIKAWYDRLGGKSTVEGHIDPKVWQKAEEEALKDWAEEQALHKPSITPVFWPCVPFACGPLLREGTLPTHLHRTPWSEALSMLFQAIRVTVTDKNDPAVKFGEEYRFPDGSTADEGALRECLLRVRVGAVEGITPLSAELARLDAEGFGARLAAMLKERFPDDMSEIMAALPIVGAANKVTRRRGRQPDTDVNQDKRIFNAWDTGSYSTYEQLANEMKITERDVRLAIDRERHRRKGAQTRTQRRNK